MRKLPAPRKHPATLFTVLLCAVVIPLAGCGDGRSAPEGVVSVRDSAGVRIVEGGGELGRWIVDSVPEAAIGSRAADTTQLLFRTQGALRLTDGRTVIALSTPPMLRWFDESGTYVAGAGRRGEGPGEFAGEGFINQLWPLSGDSVATWEHYPPRMQVFGPDGQYARATSLTLPPEMGEGTFPQVVGRLGAGFVAFLMPPFEPGTPGEVVREETSYLRWDADGQYVGEIERLPGFTQFTFAYRFPDGQERLTRGRPPFAKIPAAWSGGNRFYYAGNESDEIRVYAADGHLVSLLRPGVAVRSVTSDDIAAYRSETMARAPADPATRRQWEDQLNESPYPDAFPIYRLLRVDRTGMLWAETYRIPGASESIWWVFDPEGVRVAEVRTPLAWRVFDIGEDYLLALERDELDVEYVRRYRLQRN